VYYALQVEAPEEATELLQAVLDAAGPLGLEVRDHTLKAPPGSKPLRQGYVEIKAWFESRHEAEEAQLNVSREIPDAGTEIVEIAQEDWSESWKKHVRSVRVGRIWVGPSWEADKAADAPIRIVIDPGMAFGTGDHPTTEMCLAEIDRVVSQRQGATVLDVGTGSGVLAIAARKLGAGRVVGNDVDPTAVRIARENAASNGTPELELTEKPVERIGGSFDLVVANIFANILVQLAPRLVARTAPGGTLLLTGILATQAAEVEQAYDAEGMHVVERRASGEWVLLVLERR
jgi:ribosomal protein L11 methyltransferase